MSWVLTHARAGVGRWARRRRRRGRSAVCAVATDRALVVVGAGRRGEARPEVAVTRLKVERQALPVRGAALLAHVGARRRLDPTDRRLVHAALGAAPHPWEPRKVDGDRAVRRCRRDRRRWAVALPHVLRKQPEQSSSAQIPFGQQLQSMRLTIQLSSGMYVALSSAAFAK